MNFIELQTFLEVAEQKSFSKAATSLHLSQPAISKRIQVLEDSLNVVLFDRVGNTVLLTAAGELLYPQAQQILQGLQDAQRQLRNLSQTVSGELRLATSHHIGLHRLAPVLHKFVGLYPDVQLSIRFEDSEVAHQMALRGDIEFAVVTLNPEPEPLLSHKVIWHDPLHFVTQANPKVKNDEPKNDTEIQKPKKDTENFAPQIFPGNGFGHVATLASLAAQPCVLPGLNTYTGRIVNEQFSQAGIRLNPTMSTNYLETIGMLVGVGLGWGVLPGSMISRLTLSNQINGNLKNDGIDNVKLEKIEVPGVQMSRTLGWISNPNRSLSNAAQAFYQVLLDYRDE